MGQGDEYSRDAYIYEDAYDSDGSDDFDTDLHPEDWQDWYSEELLDAWMKIREYTDEFYIKIDAGYHKFVELVLEPEKWRGHPNPSDHARAMWSLIQDVPVVQERVTQENFFVWIENYITYL